MLPEIRAILPRFLRALALAGLACPAWALDPEVPFDQLVRATLGTEEGLPQGTVQRIFQTRDGYLWFGTEDGLARYDGARLWRVDEQVAPEMRSFHIRALFEPQAGGLLIGTLQGLYRLEANQVRELLRPDGRPFDVVEAIAETRDGTLWLGTQGEGLLAWRDGALRAFTAAGEVRITSVPTLAVDREDRLWVGTDQGLALFEAGHLSSLGDRPGSPAAVVISLSPGRDGRMWVGARGAVLRCRPAACELIADAPRLPNPRVQAVEEDADGTLWVGTLGGLHRIAAGPLETFGVEDGRARDAVRGLFEDREGTLWVGTDGAGVERYHSPRVDTLTRRDGLLGTSANSVAEASDGTVWIGTDSGLNEAREGKVLRTWGPREGLPPGAVAPVFAGGSGRVWFGTSAGLGRIEGGQFTLLTPKDGLPSLRNRALYEDSQGVLWIGSTSGLARFEGREFRTFTEAQGMSCKSVMAITGSRQGGLWLGMFGGGLQRMEGEKFRAWRSADGLGTENVYSVLEDHDGVWVGTDQGLARLQGGRLFRVGPRQGLFGAPVLQVLDDNFDRLWLTSFQGPFSVAKAELGELFAGGRSEISSAVLGRAHGLASTDMSANVHPTGWRGRDGRLWLATQQGVVIVDPRRLPTLPALPPVVIEELAVDGEVKAADEALRLEPGVRRIELRFTAPTFLAAEQLRFRARLAGFDDDWLDLGARRTVTYTNLRPGHYSFEVMAGRREGAWAGLSRQLELELLPRFYQRRWFPPLLGGLLLTLLWLGHRLRLAQLKGRFSAVLEERNRIGREIHDTLAQGLAAVALQLESAAELADSPEQARPFLGRARALVREALAGARRSVWNLRAAELEGRGLPEALESLIPKATDEAGPAVVVTVTGTRRQLPPLVEENLFRIAQEGVANARRHARAETIRVALNFAPDGLELTVADDGQGLAMEPEAGNGNRPHFGWTIMRERAEQLGGALEIVSRPGEGSVVRANLPLSGPRR